MLSRQQTVIETAGYRLKLLAMADRYTAGERHSLTREASNCADALICLMEEAPLDQRRAIDYLIDRYEDLRSRCVS